MQPLWITISGFRRRKNEDKLESHLAAMYKDASVAQKKGMKKCINRFVEEADDVLMQIGNGTFIIHLKVIKKIQLNH